MSRKRTLSLVAVVATGVVAAGAALGVSSANASPAKATHQASAVQLAAATSGTAQHDKDKEDARRAAAARAARAAREKAELNARKAKVVKAVLAKFPHARLLKLVLHKDGTWVVVLQLKNHKVGFVTVDKHLRVSTFRNLAKRDADDAMKHPSTGVTVLNSAFSPKHVLSASHM